MAHEYDTLKNVEEQGITPYPYEFQVKHQLADVISQKKMKKTYHTAGRVKIVRDFGKLIFADLHSDGKRLQISLTRDNLGEEAHKQFKKTIVAGDIIQVTGTLFYTHKNELTLQVKKFKLLAKSLYDLASKWHGLKDPELRYRQRYRDMILNDNTTKLLLMRSAIVSQMRKTLEKKGFVEVETPILQPLYGGANAEPFKTHYHALKRDFYLRISPELYLKRLTVGGMERVFEIGRNFRNEGIDTSHSPEFSMLEAYQAYADYEDMIKLNEDLFTDILKNVLKKTTFTIKEQKVSFKPPFARITMIDAIKKYAGIDVNTMSEEDLKRVLKKEKIPIRPAFTWGWGVQDVFEHFVEPKLVQPTFVMRHPKETSPLCKPCEDDPRLIERFELFAAGRELSNAYTELNDPRIQEEFFAMQQELKKRGDKEAHEPDTDFVDALKYGLPPTGGIGMGIERLLMLLLENESIRDVMFFPMLKEKK
ncbi:lysine--tRNA ligase [archaeon CG10_big_fil_rev_8_21_14_0_10_43_11]|nr:MAG: lysine--tRNA ligase [archaeon CG10_big_fil_rev_8_21_14_0_10_43_11]